MLEFKQYGDWARAGAVLRGLSSSGHVTAAFRATVDKDGKMIRDKLVGHINSQDLGWTPLSEHTIAFLSGLQTIYKELFQYGYIRFLDTLSTEVDVVYGETKHKVYKPPIKILCHFVRNRSKDKDPVKETDEKVKIKVPVKELQDNSIPFETHNDLKVLRQAVIIFNGEAYQIDEVNTKSMVAGQFLVISFDCSPCVNLLILISF